MYMLLERGVKGLLIVGLTAYFCLPQPAYAEALHAVVPSPPPTTPPTITSPDPGTTTIEKNMHIKGGCAVGLIVKIFRNAVFAGSTTCLADSTYELQIDLEEGKNTLIARQYDAVNQPSPESDPLLVFYTPPIAPTIEGSQPEGVDTTGPRIAKFELKLDYDYTLQSAFINQTFRLPIRFAGGTPPYAVSVDWGDGETSLVSRQTAVLFIAEHLFTKPGTHQIKIKISDKDGTEAFLQFVVVVNGSPDTVNIRTPFGEVRTSVSMPALVFMTSAIALPSIGIGTFVGWFLWKKRLTK
ncbi:MAG TPA: PKD domain-containing protein [Candidatus Saccharimonadales bacterium]|nr:PKD domain-containing protein [Candidatus Saccharimonadales bacterium]